MSAKAGDVQVVLSMHPSRVQEFACWLRNQAKTESARVIDYAEQIEAQGHGAHLVVIDPEDADRFVTLVADRTEDLLALDEEDRGYVMEGTTNALREFADPNPPKPEEPQGLGAVVRDANNELWIRTCDPCDDCLNKPWQRGPVHKNWYIVDAVEVLSEGYDQGADEPLADWERDLLRGQS